MDSEELDVEEELLSFIEELNEYCLLAPESREVAKSSHLKNEAEIILMYYNAINGKAVGQCSFEEKIGSSE